MININFKQDKPKFFGYSGVHLYSVNPSIEKDQKNILVTKDAQAATLYKLHNDLAIFLSNDIVPNPISKNVKTFLCFGNPIHHKNISKSKECHIVGYLNKEDIKLLSTFIKSNSLDNIKGVEIYFDKLNDEVKLRLEMLLEDRIVVELNSYLQTATQLVSYCLENNNEIVLIYNG